MYKPMEKEYTWGVKNRHPEYVIMFNMSKEDAEAVVAIHPEWWVLAPVWTKWYAPRGEKKLLIGGEKVCT